MNGKVTVSLRTSLTHWTHIGLSLIPHRFPHWFHIGFTRVHIDLTQSFARISTRAMAFTWFHIGLTHCFARVTTRIDLTLVSLGLTSISHWSL